MVKEDIIKIEFANDIVNIINDKCSKHETKTLIFCENGWNYKISNFYLSSIDFVEYGVERNNYRGYEDTNKKIFNQQKGNRIKQSALFFLENQLKPQEKSNELIVGGYCVKKFKQSKT